MSEKNIKRVENLSKSNKSVFNSKLFIDLENISIDNETNESDNSFEIESRNNTNYFLSNDLIKQLDSSSLISENDKNIIGHTNLIKNKNSQNKFNQIINPIIYNKFGFFSKNIYNNLDKKEYIKDKNKNENKKKNFEERKGDWLCIFCNNLNFSFRTKCNRCKMAKKQAVKKII
jgi:hypothetical protein